jgi:hypothetical protein
MKTFKEMVLERWKNDPALLSIHFDEFAELLARQAAIEKLLLPMINVLEQIAKQKLPAEFNDEESQGDFEYGYECVVNIARETKETVMQIRVIMENK